MEDTGALRILVRIIPGGRTGLLIFRSLAVSMLLMILLLFLNLHPILVTISFVASLFVLIKTATRKAYYTINQDSLTEEIVSKKPNTSVRSWKWENIQSYQIKRDMGRSFGEKMIVTIHCKDGYKILINSDNYNIQEGPFVDFVNRLEYQIESFNQSTDSAVHTSESNPIHKIDHKKSFYETKFSHWVFWILVAVILSLLYFMFVTGTFSGLNILRLTILLPGMIYMYQRLYGNKKNPGS